MTAIMAHRCAGAQIQLVKFQKHVIKRGQKIVLIFEGRDAAARTAQSNASSSILARVIRVSWHLVPLRTGTGMPGTFSVTSNICRLLEKSFSSTAAGTIELASSV